MRRERHNYLIIIISVIILATAYFMYSKIIIPHENYKAAEALFRDEQYDEALEAFRALKGYKDSSEKIEQVTESICARDYADAESFFRGGQYKKAAEIFKSLENYKDSENRLTEITEIMNSQEYAFAEEFFNSKDYDRAADAFRALGAYKDSPEMLAEIEEIIIERDRITGMLQPTDRSRTRYGSNTPIIATRSYYRDVDRNATQYTRWTLTINVDNNVTASFNERPHYKDGRFMDYLGHSISDIPINWDTENRINTFSHAGNKYSITILESSASINLLSGADDSLCGLYYSKSTSDAVISNGSKSSDNTSSQTYKSQPQAHTPTQGEKNALRSAKEYLKFMPFSYKGLVEQLEYEGYTHTEAVYGADNCGANWKDQAAKAAKNYLDMMPFSRSGLIEQLEYEGYTHEQAEYGARQNGY